MTPCTPNFILELRWFFNEKAEGWNTTCWSSLVLLTTVQADGINLGLTKMAESCPGTTKSSLEVIQAWYIKDETYSAALAELVNAQKTASGGILGRWNKVIF